MLQLTFKVVEYTFKQPFRISKGVKTKQPALLLSLDFKNLFRGYGETTEIAYYNNSVDEMAGLLAKKKRLIEHYAMNGPERFWHYLHHLLPGQNFLISALDMAGWDLWAKMSAESVQSLMGLSNVHNPLTDYTIGIGSPDEIREKVKAQPWPIYKLKVGGEQDKENLLALREAAPEAIIRIDANEAWDIEKAKALLPTLEDCKVELIEQPFHRADTENLQKFRQETDIPVIADEACQEETDLIRCLTQYDGVNIKLSKCGGLTPAFRMIKIIRDSGKKVMLGGMCEGNIGATALAQLLPLADYADIDGPLLIDYSPGMGLDIKEGVITLPYGPGFGLRFK